MAVYLPGGSIPRQTHRTGSVTVTGTRTIIYPSLWRAIQKFYKTRSDVAEDQRVVVLSRLVTNNRRIGAVRRSELVLSSVGDPGGQAEEESLYGNDVNGID